MTMNKETRYILAFGDSLTEGKLGATFFRSTIEKEFCSIAGGV